MDPSGGGGIGKAASELLQEMQKAQQDMQKQPGVGGAGSPQTSFQSHLQQAQSTNQVQGIEQTGKVNEVSKANNILAQAKINANIASTQVGQSVRTENSKLGQMVTKLVNGQDKMTKIMNMAMSGRQFNPQELLALQAGVYRFTQEMELTSKVVEKATSGIKQTMNTQV